MAASRSIKAARIAELLANPTYLPESGLVRRLLDSLMKLSMADLAGLNLIVQLKLDAAERK